MKKRLALSTGSFMLLLIILAAALFRPVPILPEHELSITSGIVDEVFEGGEKDIVFKLKEEDQLYYINRGLEQSLSLSELRAKLIGNEVTIKYPEYWTLINSDYSRHLSKLEFEGSTIYSEVD